MIYDVYIAIMEIHHYYQILADSAFLPSNCCYLPFKIYKPL